MISIVGYDKLRSVKEYISPEIIKAIQPALDVVNVMGREDAKKDKTLGKVFGPNFDPQSAVEAALPVAMENIRKLREDRSKSIFSMNIRGRENWHEEIFGNQAGKNPNSK